MSWYTKRDILPERLKERADGTDSRVNLLQGVPVLRITTDAPLGVTYENDYHNTKDTVGLMTDGVTAKTNSYQDPAYFHFSRGGGRSIVFKLESLSAVQSVSVGFLREDEVGVRLPRRVDVYLSPDGENWQRVIKARNIASKDTPETVIISADFEKPYIAGYITVEFDVPCHIWVDEVQAIGTTKIPADAVEITAEEKEGCDEVRYVDKYPEYSDLCGIHNIMLAYNCLPPKNMRDERSGLTTVEQFIPHLGYINKNGEMTDTFFDSMLFLPYSAYTYSSLYKCADGWKYYVDNTFAENANVDALDKAAAEVQSRLGLDELKIKVFLSILHTKVTYGEFPEKFGDLDGDGIDEDINSFEGRKKAVKWCIDTQLERYAEKDRAHLELSGFYWFEEVINYSDEFELPLLEFAREYVHSKGLKLIWIPYFEAWGYADWKENGFDVACMQPNYAFRKQEPVKRLYDNAAMTKQLGMCYELEIGGLSPEDIERYTQYLDCGAETGFMQTIKMYYQGGVPGEFYRSFESDDPVTRSVYDNTYLFAKEKYVSRGLVKPEDIE